MSILFHFSTPSPPPLLITDVLSRVVTGCCRAISSHKSTVKRATTNVQLVSNIIEKALLRVLPTAFKPVLQQIRSLQVASIRTSDIYWIKVQASYVTCCKQVRRGKFGKTRDMYRFCCKKYNNPLISAITLGVLQQLDMLQYRFMIRGW